MGLSATSRMVLIAAFFAGACSFPINTPKKFVEIDGDATREYRAITADGVVFTGRREDSNQDKGADLDFWVQAVENRVRHMGGYALIEKKDFSTKSGHKGKKLVFGHDEKQIPYRYWVALVIDGDDLYVLEAGGDEESFKKVASNIDAAIRTLSP